MTEQLDRWPCQALLGGRDTALKMCDPDGKCTHPECRPPTEQSEMTVDEVNALLKGLGETVDTLSDGAIAINEMIDTLPLLDYEQKKLVAIMSRVDSVATELDRFYFAIHGRFLA